MAEMEAKVNKMDEDQPKRKRKRRWGDESDKVDLHAVNASGSLTGVTRNDPQLIQYAIRVFGTTDLEESQWKQCEDQIKVSTFVHVIFFFLSTGDENSSLH